MRTGSRLRQEQGGFTYLGLMLFMTLSGLALAAAGMVWHTESMREKERQLLFVGEEFRQAIASYYDSSPQGVREFPLTLEALLHDARFPVVKRHLRRIYADPMTGKADWEFIREQGRIVGVHSLSQAEPIKKSGFTEAQQEFAKAETYRDWRFTYASGMGGDASGAGTASVTPMQAEAPQPTAAQSYGSDRREVSVPAAQASSSSDPGRRQQCLKQRMNDIATCRESCGQSNSGACSQCQASAMQRYRDCI